MDYGGTLVDENLRKKLAEESVQRLDSGLKSASQGLEPVVSPAYGAGATPRPLPPKVTTAPVAPAAPMAAGKPATPVATKPVAPVPPLPGNPNFDPAYNAPDLKPGSPEQVAAYGSFGNARAFAADATGRTVLDNAAKKGAGGTQRVVAGDSRQIGESRPLLSGAPFEPMLGAGASNGVRGSSSVPQYETNYTLFGKNGPQGTASIVGPNQRVGGGTVSAPDQGNGGTVEGNVAALNRQIEALRGLREARNPGITTGGGAKDRLYAADATLAGNRLKAEQQAEKNAIEAYKAATERMGVKPPGLESAYLELMNRRALATDPKDIALIDEQLQQIKDYRRADPMATLNQTQGALQ